MDWATANVHLIGVLLRVGVFISFCQSLQERPEVSTPVNSFRRLMEGSYLNRNGIVPYDGDVFHEQPILIYVMTLLSIQSIKIITTILIICDHLTAWFLGSAATKALRQMKIEQDQTQKAPKAVEVEKCVNLIEDTTINYVSLTVQMWYLFNPFSILTSAAATTTVLQNLLISATLYALVSEVTILAACLAAMAALLGFYPCVLIVPIALVAAKDKNTRPFRFWQLLLSVIAFAFLWFGSLWLTAICTGSWSFLRSTYWFLMSAPELTPNVGVFWYFFTEVFDHFRLFFLWVFQLNIFIYIIPLALTLRKSPILLYQLLLILTAIFKPYPCVGDAAIFIALLPIWRHLYPYIRHSFLVGCTLAVFATLGPVMWKLWIYDGSANANFYFAITLAYSAALIFLLTDLLYANLRYSIHFEHGAKVTAKDGNEAKISLT